MGEIGAIRTSSTIDYFSVQACATLHMGGTAIGIDI